MYGVEHVAIFPLCDRWMMGGYLPLSCKRHERTCRLQTIIVVYGITCNTDGFYWDISKCWSQLKGRRNLLTGVMWSNLNLLFVTCGRYQTLDIKGRKEDQGGDWTEVLHDKMWDILMCSLAHLHSKNIVKILSWASFRKQRCNEAILNAHWLVAS